MPFTMFTLAMLFICILCIGREVFRGFVRGPLCALVSLCAVILSMICSIFVSRATGGIIAEALMENVINDLIVDNVEIIANFLSVFKTASFLIQVVANIIVFAVTFPLFKWILGSLINCVINSVRKKMGATVQTEKMADKLLGATVGIVCGMLVAVAVIAPIMGTVHLFGNVIDLVDNISECIPPEQNIEIPELEEIDTYTNDAVGNFCYTIGGELIYRHLMTAEFNGKPINAIDEISTLEKATASAIGIVGSFSQEDAAFDFEESSQNVYACFEESQILRTVALEFVSDFSATWMRGEGFMGIYMPDFSNDFRPLVNEILLTCSNINEYNILPTAKTLLDIVGVIIECDIRVDSSTEEVDYYLLASKLWNVFENNPGMESVKWQLESVANIAIADFVSQNLTNSQRAAIVTSIASDTAEILIEFEGTDARVEAVGAKILERFEELELSVDPSLCDLFAYKLIKIAEENYDQISSSDVDTLLTKTVGGMTN